MFVHLCKTFLSPGEHLLFKGLQEVEKLKKKKKKAFFQLKLRKRPQLPMQSLEEG